MAIELQISGLPLAVSLALTDQIPMDDVLNVTYKWTRAQQNTFLANYFVLQTALQAQSFVYATDTGAANAYAIAPSPALAAYADGQMVSFVAAHANTGASTLAVNALAAKAIVTNDGVALKANMILANGSYNAQYSTGLGGKFILLNPSINVGGPFLPLGGGTMSGAINMGTFGITNAANPINPQDLATKLYVDQNALNGTSVYAATTTNLNVTQSGAGVGATLTDASGTFAAFSVDSVSPPVGSNILVKNLAISASHQGVYTLTTNGDGISVPYQLTRATNFDTVTEINTTGLIVIQNGSTLSGTAWYNTATIVTVDTTNFNFAEFGNITFPISMAHGGTGANLTPSFGAIPYSNASVIALLAPGVLGQLFQSGGAGAPNWTTATYPTTAGTAGNLMTSDGTNFNSTPPTPAQAGALTALNYLLMGG